LSEVFPDIQIRSHFLCGLYRCI